MVFLNDPYNFSRFIPDNQDITQWMSEKNNIVDFFDNIGLFNRRNELRIAVSDIIHSFSNNNDNILKSYFNRDVNLKDILYRVIDHIKRTNLLSSLSVPMLKNIFSKQELSIYKTISSQVNYKFPKENISIFGLGLADGAFETQISKKLGYQKPSIFGYDKNFLNIDSNIKYVSNPNEIDRSINIFSARWVLHHLPDKDRWNSLKEWFNIMSNHSVCIFVEEGCCLYSNTNLHEFYFYEFILGVFDVCSNIIFCPNWINLQEEEYKDKFSLKYLSLDDILQIRELFDPKSKLKIIPSYSDYFVENIILLER